jgi:ABC-2 type transport system permease protein
MNSLKAELIKCKHSPIIPISFIIFSMVPLMAGIMMQVMKNPGILADASLIKTKMEVLNVSANWDAMFLILKQGMGIGGIVIFGFLVSWLFGREYSDHTLKDLLSLPTTKTAIIHAKLTVFFLWAIALAISYLLLGMLIGIILCLPGFDVAGFSIHLQEYAITTLLTLLISVPIAFFAMLGRGYLAPLGFFILTVFFSQIIAALGLGHYFPWAIPALYSGAAGEYKEQLNVMSYVVLIITSIAGYCMTVIYWNKTDHSK